MTEKARVTAKPEVKSENSVYHALSPLSSQSTHSPFRTRPLITRELSGLKDEDRTSRSLQEPGSSIPEGHNFSRVRIHPKGAVHTPPIQTKLRINKPGDVYEEEADRVAEQVMRMEEPGVRRQVEEEETLQAKEIPSQIPEVTPNLEARINAIRGGGQPLPESTRAFFEPRFGHDFSQVRVHTDAQAAEAARAVNARAFTAGRDVVFGAGKYAPGTSEGRRLMAHELTHVVQQGGAQETYQRHVHRQEEEEALQIKAEAALVQRQAEEEEPIHTKIEGVRVQRQLSAEQPAKGWSLRTAVVTVSWSKDFDTLYRRLIAALATKPAFAGLPKKSLWVFGPAVDAFRLITCGEMCAQFKEGDEVRLTAGAWADPTHHELAENALIGMGIVKVGLGSVIEEEESKHVAAGPEESKKAWSEVPWTEQELQSFKNEDFNEYMKTGHYSESEVIRIVRQKIFYGEQIIKNWNNRYGRWDYEGLKKYEWAKWFHDNETLNPSGNPKSLNRQEKKQLLKEFLNAFKLAGEAYGRRTTGGSFISGIRDAKDHYNWCLAEYEERDPTSLQFDMNYRDFIKFKITDQSLKRLPSKGVPNEVVDQLKYIKNLEVVEGEKQFLDFVKVFIGDEYYNKYKFMIWRQALIRRRVEPTKAAQKKAKDIPLALGPMGNKELEAKIKELGDEI